MFIFRTVAIQAYAVALQNIWIKSFGEQHVIASKKCIKQKLKDILTSCNNTVHIEGTTVMLYVSVFLQLLI